LWQQQQYENGTVRRRFYLEVNVIEIQQTQPVTAMARVVGGFLCAFQMIGPNFSRHRPVLGYHLAASQAGRATLSPAFLLDREIQ
jgi:hypothetical protein